MNYEWFLLSPCLLVFFQHGRYILHFMRAEADTAGCQTVVFTFVLSTNINIHILSNVIHIFLMVQIERICIKTKIVDDQFLYTLDLFVWPGSNFVGKVRCWSLLGTPGLG